MAGRIGRGPVGGFDEFLASIPLVTKIHAASLILLSVSAKFGIINPVYLVITYSDIQNFQIWRFITGALIAKLDFSFLMLLMFLLQYGKDVELTIGTASYIVLIAFAMFFCSIVALLLPMQVTTQAVIFATVYYWSRLNSGVEVTFMFGIKFQAVFFPWVLVAFSVLLGGMPVMELTGIIVGHLYYFLEQICPIMYGRTLIWTPQWLLKKFPRVARVGAGGSEGFEMRPPPGRGDGDGGGSGGGRGGGSGSSRGGLFAGTGNRLS